jgi:predicted TIM-barrel fold metal-dependent hydrolase
MLSRRRFLGTAAAAVSVSGLNAQPQSEWGGPVLDTHLHYRAQPGANLAHIEGSGVIRAVLLTDANQDARAAAEPSDRFSRFTSTNVARPDSADILRRAVQSGSLGLGELKSQVAADGPEMRRMYELAAELKVPVLLHFQEFSDPLSVGTYNTGFDRLPALLKEYPNTVFIGHANSFWANISAEVPANVSYPAGPVKRGGLTDRLLSDAPNLYGDLSATSGRNALARDLDFSADFLARHQDKLIFGSDCGCLDGRGTGQTNPLPLVAGKCVARETLSALKQLTSAEVFRKITWENGVRLLKIKV